MSPGSGPSRDAIPDLDQEPDMDSCDRCDAEAEHKVAVAANYEGAHVTWRPLCDDCLLALGEWWRSDTGGVKP